MGYFRKHILIAGVVLLSACAHPPKEAAVAPSPYQTISVMTPGSAGAWCFLRAGERQYGVTAPGDVEVLRAVDPMTVSCHKGKHFTGTQVVRPIVSAEEKNIAGDCVSCRYPASVSVALALNSASLAVTVRQVP